MLTITVGGTDVFDESSGEFTTQGGVQLQLEHSLVSLSKWETIYEKPFLDTSSKTPEEIVKYVECMALDPKIPPEVFPELSKENFEEINEYFNRKMSATFFPGQPGAPAAREVITSELIYYWMTVFSIPFECENWNLNRLFTLIRIANLKQSNSKPQKMSRADAAARRRELNAQRRAQLGTKG